MKQLALLYDLLAVSAPFMPKWGEYLIFLRTFKWWGADIKCTMFPEEFTHFALAPWQFIIH